MYDGPSGGAALACEGRLLAIAEEDRLVRRSRVAGIPRASLQSVFRESGVPGAEVTTVVVATRNAAYAEGAGQSARPPLIYRVGTAPPSPPPVERRIRDSFARARCRRIDEALRSEFGLACPVRFLDHHLVHALGAACTTGRPQCLVITMDRGADGKWAQVTSFRRGKARAITFQSGFGTVFGFLDAACDHLGIPPGLDRYSRLEELAGRGEAAAEDTLATLLRCDEGWIVHPRSRNGKDDALSRIVDGRGAADLAASTLSVAGRVTREFTRYWYARSAHESLVLGGDLFEIPSLAGAVRRDGTRGALVSPTPGDVGLPVGGAFAGCLPGILEDPLPVPSSALPTPFLGTSYDEKACEDALAREAAPYRHPREIERDVARVLARGKSVARFDGKTEIGHRGLGNRAVLRHPQGGLRRGRLGFVLGTDAYHTLVTEEAFADWFDRSEAAPRDLRHVPGPVRPHPGFATRCPELLRWQGRAPVQTVSNESSPRLHRILKEFESRTGLPFLAAAPYRLPGEPLVSSPRDALRIFRLLGADYAALGRFLVRNR